MADPRAQVLRRLPGRFVAEMLPADAEPPAGDWLALVRAPGGLTVVRPARDGEDGWLALDSGGTAHPPEATGMLAALVGPLAEARVPVFVASSYEADLVLVPEGRAGDAERALRAAGHAVEA